MKNLFPNAARHHFFCKRKKTAFFLLLLFGLYLCNSSGCLFTITSQGAVSSAQSESPSLDQFQRGILPDKMPG